MTVEKLSKTQTLRVNLLALLIACGVFLIGLFWVQLHNEADELSEDLKLTALVSSKSDAIEQHLALTLMATRMLEVQIRLNNGSRIGFHEYAPEILATTPGVSNIQLAPNGIITDIYPLAGNERAIGHNILKDDRRRDEARKAVSTRKTTLAGPFELIQGGVAVIGRQPVFVEDGRQENFWGFASALIHLDELLKVARFDELEKQGYAYELSFKEIGTGKTKMIQASASQLGDFWHQESIQVPNSFWTLKIGLSEHSSPHNFLLSLILLSVAALASYLFSFYLLRQPEYLRMQISGLKKQLGQQSYTDPLTDLCNRQSLSSSLEALQKEMDQKPSIAALLVVDLDNFRTINERLGSGKGDEFLKNTAKKLCALTRESDIAARIGGDEFAVLIRNISSQDEAAMVADKILNNIALPVAGISDLYPVTASIGITLIHPGDSGPNQALHSADQAMRLAKQNGKGRHYFAQTSPFGTAKEGTGENEEMDLETDEKPNEVTKKGSSDSDDAGDKTNPS